MSTLFLHSQVPPGLSLVVPFEVLLNTDPGASTGAGILSPPVIETGHSMTAKSKKHFDSIVRQALQNH